jgi:inosine/xanthosine triphosphatase
MKRVCVVSKNQVKIDAVRIAFEKLINNEEFNFLGLGAASDVDDQPKTESETKKGAYNRILNATKIYEGYDYYVSIEGGVVKDLETNYYDCLAYVCISHLGVISFSRSSTFTLPKKVGELLDQGKELGEADDIVFNRTNSKQLNGAIGLLTNDKITRTSFYTEPIMLALIPHLNSELYK